MEFLKKNKHFLIFENFGEKVDFLLFFDFSSFFYGSEISGKQTNSKKISKMNTKVHKNNFRNFKSSKLVSIFGLKALCTKA